eukprot:scaffold29_cov251-Pinguiococcus_pyrenoidosus.AAC.29
MVASTSATLCWCAALSTHFVDSSSRRCSATKTSMSDTQVASQSALWRSAIASTPSGRRVGAHESLTEDASRSLRSGSTTETTLEGDSARAAQHLDTALPASSCGRSRIQAISAPVRIFSASSVSEGSRKAKEPTLGHLAAPVQTPSAAFRRTAHVHEGTREATASLMLSATNIAMPAAPGLCVGDEGGKLGGRSDSASNARLQQSASCLTRLEPFKFKSPSGDFWICVFKDSRLPHPASHCPVSLVARRENAIPRRLVEMPRGQQSTPNASSSNSTA